MRKDNSPLRHLYVDGNDLLIYKIVLNYVEAADRVFWERAEESSFILKSVGVQALFDILRLIVSVVLESKNVSTQAFVERLAPAAHVDFAAERFRSPSGSGRTFIRKVLAANMGLPADLTAEDRQAFVR